MRSRLSQRFDAIVVGQGILGLAAASSLARAGMRVLSLERFSGHHDKGASWGDTRLIRKSYFEDPRYFPLLESAYRAWAALEAESGRALYHRRGLFLAGDPSESTSMAQILGGNFAGIVQPLSARELGERFPMFRLPTGMRAAFEADAGFLDVPACHAALAGVANQKGALRLENASVTLIEERGEDVALHTEQGTFNAAQVVLAAGAWLADLLPDFPLPLRTQPGPQYWFAADPSLRDAPCFGFFERDDFVYGFPAREGYGVKVAGYAPLPETIDPDLRAEVPDPWPVAPIARVVTERLVGLAPEPQRRHMCHYHLAADENFILAKAPGRSRIFVLGGCSGHAFKFAPALGDLLLPLLAGDPLPSEAAFLGLR